MSILHDPPSQFACTQTIVHKQGRGGAGRPPKRKPGRPAGAYSRMNEDERREYNRQARRRSQREIQPSPCGASGEALLDLQHTVRVAGASFRGRGKGRWVYLQPLRKNTSAGEERSCSAGACDRVPGYFQAPSHFPCASEGSEAAVLGVAPAGRTAVLVLLAPCEQNDHLHFALRQKDRQREDVILCPSCVSTVGLSLAHDIFVDCVEEDVVE